MSGRPGRSGGGNKIDPAVHLLRGTFRPGRHTLPSSSKTAEWTPTAAQRAALDPAGQAFVTRLLAQYVFNPMEGEVVLRTARVCDRLEQIEQARDGADVDLRLKLDRVEQGYLRQFSTFMNALKVSR